MDITRYVYEAPPKSEDPEGDNVIVVPEEEGTPVTVLVTENGMTTYLHREQHDYTASIRLIAFITDWLHMTEEPFIGLPNSQYPDFPVWVPRYTLLHAMNIHDATVVSPLAREKQHGKRIVVPMGDGVATITGHGPGKRR